MGEVTQQGREGSSVKGDSAGSLLQGMRILHMIVSEASERASTSLMIPTSACPLNPYSIHDLSLHAHTHNSH